MLVCQAYRYRLVEDEHGSWGNNTLESMLKQFPLLAPLVAELQSVKTWGLERDEKGHGWTALFFEDHLTGREPIVSLDMKTSALSIHCTKLMVIDVNNPPTLMEVMAHILASIRRR